MVKPESRRWTSHAFDTAEEALLDWLATPLTQRKGGLICEDAPGIRNPRDDEVSLGILVVTDHAAALLRHRLRVEGVKGRPDAYARVKAIRLGGREFEERDVVARADIARVRAAIAREGEPVRLRPRGESRADPPGPARDDVVEAEWSEVAAGEPRPAEAAATEPPRPTAGEAAREGGRAPGIDATAYRGALVICAELSPASGPAFRAACDEAYERLDDFLAMPLPPKARNAARTAGALLHALPRHFPSAEAAGKWAMVARPAIGAFAEAALAFASTTSVAALEHRPPAAADQGQAAPDAAGHASVADGPEAPGPADAGPGDAPSREAPGEARDESVPGDAAGHGDPAGDGPREAAASPGKPDASAGPGSLADAPPRRGRPRRESRAAGAAPARGARHAGAEAAVATATAVNPAPGAGRRLTATERKVVSAMSRNKPMRKKDIALGAGIGRGSCNRIVDRLVQAGLAREALPLRYVVGEGVSP